MSTDQRARAVGLRAKLLKDMESRKGFRRDMIDAVTKNEWDNEWDEIILTALADERRRAWEEATEIATILKASRRPSLDWGAGYIEACKDMLAAIAKAHAGQEG